MNANTGDVATFSRADRAFLDLQAVVAERTSPIVLWVGAGLSAAAGLPLWTDLRRKLHEEGAAKAATLEAPGGDDLLRMLRTIEGEKNLWVAFERLRDAIGVETFQRCIKRELSGAATAVIPEGYKLMWNLPIRGVLTLNLDRLAFRSFSTVHSGDLINEYNGPEMARLRQLLFGKSKFVGNLHGNFEDSASWIFTKREIDTLLKNSDYTEFLRLVLSSCVNVFLGMSVDDIAVGGQLSKLAERDVSAPPRFWFSDRAGTEVDKWAEDRGTRVIRYRPIPSHEAAVEDFLRELVVAKPSRDLEPLPVRPPSVGGVEAIFPPENLDELSGDALRQALNAHASQLLADTSADGAAAYEAFCSEYDEEIHKAWYVPSRAGKNELLGYRLQERIARGAFGQVYRARGPSGEDVAVKLLLQEVHEDRDLLRSFRQGVQSMQILKRHDIDSMVAYKAAYEIPAFVVMDWVDGPNLAELRNAQQVDGWDILLRIAHDLAQVIKLAHSLPERILHRDIRPANVMLRGYWDGGLDWKLVVLDFDLSWHRGLEQKSVYFSTAVGYLAPEQIDARSDSTRNAVVDSFGVGMTYYYLLTGRDPLPEQHRHVDFAEVVHRAADGLEADLPWKSLPKRFARLVLRATADRQASRADMSEIVAEVEVLRKCLGGDRRAIPAEFVAEELAAHVGAFRDYAIDQSQPGFMSHGRSGVTFILTPDEPKGRVYLRIVWARTGVEQRANLGKYVEQGSRATKEGLESAGWKVDRHSYGGQSMEIVASCGSDLLAREMLAIADGTDQALNRLKFGA